MRNLVAEQGIVVETALVYDSGKRTLFLVVLDSGVHPGEELPMFEIVGEVPGFYESVESGHELLVLVVQNCNRGTDHVYDFFP